MYSGLSTLVWACGTLGKGRVSAFRMKSPSCPPLRIGVDAMEAHVMTCLDGGIVRVGGGRGSCECDYVWSAPHVSTSLVLHVV